MSPSLLGRRARLLLLVATSMILHSYASLPLLSTMNVYIAQFFLCAYGTTMDLHPF